MGKGAGERVGKGLGNGFLASRVFGLGKELGKGFGEGLGKRQPLPQPLSPTPSRTPSPTLFPNSFPWGWNAVGEVEEGGGQGRGGCPEEGAREMARGRGREEENTGEGRVL